jgi:hypothetical protein
MVKRRQLPRADDPGTGAAESPKPTGDAQDEISLQKPDRGKKLRVQRRTKSQKKRTLNRVDALIREAYELSLSELKSLHSALDGLIQASEEKLRVQSKPEFPEIRTLNALKKVRRGSFELKPINGCGPYLYLRWWDAGNHRSTYIGKPKDES